MSLARMTQKDLARAIGMADTLMGRSIRGSRPLTVKEFELIAGTLDAPAHELLDTALSRFGGMPKLLAEPAERLAMSEVTHSVDVVAEKRREKQPLGNDWHAHGEPAAAQRDSDNEEDEIEST